MKLLFCLRCQDVRKLRVGGTRCACGDSFGRYLANGHDAEYGGPSRVIGIGNGSLVAAIHGSHGTEKPGGVADFLAWVKPLECRRLRRVEDGTDAPEDPRYLAGLTLELLEELRTLPGVRWVQLTADERPGCHRYLAVVETEASGRMPVFAATGTGPTPGEALLMARAEMAEQGGAALPPEPTP